MHTQNKKSTHGVSCCAAAATSLPLTPPQHASGRCLHINNGPDDQPNTAQHKHHRHHHHHRTNTLLACFSTANHCWHVSSGLLATTHTCWLSFSVEARHVELSQPAALTVAQQAVQLQPGQLGAGGGNLKATQLLLTERDIERGRARGRIPAGTQKCYQQKKPTGCHRKPLSATTSVELARLQPCYNRPIQSKTRRMLHRAPNAVALCWLAAS